MVRLAARLGVMACCIIVIALLIRFLVGNISENRVLKEVIKNLEADSRVAEVLVTGVNYDDATGKRATTIKFLEYDIRGKPLQPRYFTFSGNIIQFQCLVVRFDNALIRKNDRLRGKSAYLFWKVFMLDGPNTQEYEITRAYEIPDGYRIDRPKTAFEERLWKDFWKYALASDTAAGAGVKNAQIEAPGTMFVPGMLYTIKIEHDGGLRIDASDLPHIVHGERIPEEVSVQ